VPDPYSWPLDDILLVVPLQIGLYAFLLRRYPASRLRLASFALSQLLLLVAYATPLETIALHYLLSVHLLQNVIAAEWAPGLAILGLPPALAAAAEGRIPLVRRLTSPLVGLPVWLATYGFWHVPAVYDYALRRPESVLHLEHATYFLSGCLLWWPVIHGRMSSGAKAGYLFTAFLLASPIGLLLALLPRAVYGFYADGPGLWGLAPLTDQQIAGVTMASEQAVVFFAVFAYWFMRFLREQEEQEEEDETFGDAPA
jgi:cytochrome c oxidase assembly factor CtaG